MQENFTLSTKVGEGFAEVMTFETRSEERIVVDHMKREENQIAFMVAAYTKASC